MAAIPHRQSINLGVLYGVLSALSFSIMIVLVKLIWQTLPTVEVLFFRFTISLIFFLPWFFWGSDFSFKIQDTVHYVIRILTALAALFCVFYAVKFVPLIDALLLYNTAPLFVPIIAYVLLSAKIPKKTFLGIIIGFIGVAFILHPGREILTLAALIALASGFLSGLAMVNVRIISKTSTTKQMIFYFLSVSTVILGLLSIFQWQTPDGKYIWLLLLGIGVFGTFFQLFFTLSYVTAPVDIVAPLIFLIAVFGGIFDWIIWKHVPTIPSIVGGLCVVVGAIITLYFGKREVPLNK